MLRILLPMAVLAVTICGCKRQDRPAEVREERSQHMTISVSSSAFQEGGMIPAKYTCDGDDLSPPLQWAETPEGARSIALI